MPTFHFACKQCKAKFEMKLPFGDKTVPQCVECSSADVQKLIKPPLISFKGSGFYKTDSRAPSPPSSTSTTSAENNKPATPAAPAKPPSPASNA